MPLPRPRLAPLVLVLLAAVVPPLAAQLPPLTAPKGLLRLELGGRFDNWDKMFFDGVKRDAAGDFVRDPADGTWLPVLGEVEQRIRAISGVQASVSLALGKTSAHELVNVGTESIGAAYGLTRRLTLFGTIPIVRVRVQEVFSLDSTNATATFNPADPIFGTGDGTAQNGFFSQLQAALLTLDSKLQNGDYNGNPQLLTLAQATLARGTALQTALLDFFATSTFIPLTGSSGAAALNGSIDSLRTHLAAELSIPGFTAAPVFPTDGLAHDALEGFATNPAGPVQAQPFEPPILRGIGDIEVGAAFLWLDRRPARGLAVRSALQGTVRLRTGKLARPDGLFDLPTGDRQPDVQGDLVTDLGAGAIGARVTARYVLQLPGRQSRRLTPPDQPFAPATTLALVERDPGEIIEGSLEPYLRIASHFSIVAGIRHWKKAIDKYNYAPNQGPIAGTTPAVLAIGSKTNGTVLSAALSFVHDGLRRDGTAGIPIDAILRGELVVGSSQGRVPVKQSISLVLRLYRKIF
jgi:hypothetical protein